MMRLISSVYLSSKLLGKASVVNYLLSMNNDITLLLVYELVREKSNCWGYGPPPPPYLIISWQSLTSSYFSTLLTNSIVHGHSSIKILFITSGPDHKKTCLLQPGKIQTSLLIYRIS